MTRQITREQWLADLYAKCDPIGTCEEWTGSFMANGKTPLVYVPRGFVREGLSQSRQSVRVVLWTLHHGAPPAPGAVLRCRCRNDACVAVDHMIALTRAEAPAEQGRRGEFSTPQRKAASLARARRDPNTKLTAEKAREIRLSDEPSKVLAPIYGVSTASINAIRRGKLWPEATRGSSIFNMGSLT